MGAFRKLLYIGFAVLLSLGAVSYTFAQSTGVIRGTVTDPSGAAIANASVTQHKPAPGLRARAATNDQRHLCVSRSANR